MEQISYKLSDIPGFNDLLKEKINDHKHMTCTNYSTKSKQNYKIIRYKKEMLSYDLVKTYGVLRSVIVNSEGRVVCFSPPKSVLAEKFIENYPGSFSSSIVAEEFVEGTMINVFFDPSVECWQIATRNTVGADVSFYKGAKTFHEMFNEACVENGFNITTLNTEYCYSFVLQHPNNRIVVPFNKAKLYLVDVFHIIHDGDTIAVKENPYEYSHLLNGSTTVSFPKKYDFMNYKDLIEEFASPNTPYEIMGVVIRNIETCERCKIRNPIYEEVRQLRGNQPKLQYQYLCLRKEGRVKDFLNYYPEKREELSKFRDIVHIFTESLHKNYISCYVKKETPLKEFPDQYRTHMFKLHEIFLNDLREKGQFVNNTVVIQYVNNLHPSLLMYSLNHNMRKRIIDNIKADSEV
jgi:hypothetical protein